MKKHTINMSVWWIPIIFLMGLLAGALITVSLALAGNGKEQAAESLSQEQTMSSKTEQREPDSEDKGQNGNETMPDSEVTQDGRDNDMKSSVSKWNSEQVYLGGDIVLYGSKYYRAKWWTQNEIPGNADVWEDTKEAPGPHEGALINSESNSRANQEYGRTGQAPSSQGQEIPTREDNSFRIVAYYPSWAAGSTYPGTNISEKVQWDKITHLVYAFAIPAADSSLRPLEQSQLAEELIQTAHENGVKVLLAIGGWSYNEIPLESTFAAATDTQEKTERLAEAIVDMAEDYGFDGVDLDWEHPRVDGSSGVQYEDLVLLLADKLHQKDLLLSTAVLSGATADGNIYYDAAAYSDAALEAVDWINVMAYDGGDGERHSTYDFAVNSASYWKEERGVPADKINLGVPFYSRPGWASYDALLQNDPGAVDGDTSLYNGMEVWYNGTDTIRRKTQYALDNLGGIMIWEITQDTAERGKSLLSAIWDTVAASGNLS